MKLVIEGVLVPSGILLVLLVAAMVALFLLRRRSLAVHLFTAAALFYVVFGSSLTTLWLMGGLEREFPAGQEAAAAVRPDTVVVLTGFGQHYPPRPITGQVNSASAFRLLEAARLVTRDRQLRVLISGDGEVPSVMKDLLVQLGVAASGIDTDAGSEDTYESAMHLRERLAGRSFYLVTSAGHMPRAMRVFRRQGLAAIPAPTGYLAPVTLTVSNLLPSADNLAISDLAVHEYLAMLWYRIQDRI